MTKKDLHLTILYTVVGLYLLFAHSNSWAYGHNYVLYNYLIIFYVLFHVGYIVFNKRDFMMTTSKLRKYGFDYNLKYKCQSKQNGIIDRIFVNDYNDEYWYELDYLLTIHRGCTVAEYNEFIGKNSSVHKLYSTMVSKRKNSKTIMKEYVTSKNEYNTSRISFLMLLILIAFLSLAVIAKKGYIL